MDSPSDLMEKATILVVDDTPGDILLISGLLERLYHVRVARHAETALKICGSDAPPDLVLLDLTMPDMDGYEICRRLKANPLSAQLPVILLSAANEIEDESRGLALGAVDYIAQPIRPALLLARVKTQLMLKAGADFLRDKNAFLECEIERRTREIAAIQAVTVQAMASLAETRDSDSGNHIRRTQHYVKLLAEKLREHPRFKGQLNDFYIEMLFKSAPLHDIGKVGIPDRILLKPGRLDEAEFAIMKTHTALGREAIEQAEKSLGLSVEFLQMAKEIALSHQEKWDGSGYPEGLAGEAIPVSARLMALADVYDALTSRRVYKKAISHDKAVQIIATGKGQHFDPDVTDAFLELEQEFHAVARKFPDSEDEIEDKAKQIRQILRNMDGRE
ncbi:MAG: two-component system response regulator [Burkholderiales bacterium]|nr:two-component system response regulator [Burkholderiales bacterium]